MKKIDLKLCLYALLGFVVAYLATVGLGYITQEVMVANIEAERMRVRAYVRELIEEQRKATN